MDNELLSYAKLHQDTDRHRVARAPRKLKTLISKCLHVDQPYYAKGLCAYCYHRKGRQKLATHCFHADCPSYAFGMCKKCYLKQY